ncbi:MAG: hypothetical protein EPO08_10120 [Rhodospirillaceae bacterium]|nr:MAG: hypothetical protein EPO08_10120 [Rhodospirillaceae bacterium]
MRHFTHEENERIRAAIAAVERRTHAHFAFVVTPVSDRYVLFPIVWSAVLALVAGGIVALGWPHFALRMAFGIQAVTFVGLSLICEWLPIRLMLVPKHFKHMRAKHMAHREFAARVLSRKDHRDGILFFVSQAERYVEILASHDVHARVGEDVWQSIINDFVAAVGAGRRTEGFVAGIDACGTLLATHFPAASAPGL